METRSLRRSLRLLPALLVSLSASALSAQTALTPSGGATDTPPAAAVKLEDFVVTGVFNATEAKKATTAITTLTSAYLAEQVYRFDVPSTPFGGAEVNFSVVAVVRL
jgi:hypothetical protein